MTVEGLLRRVAAWIEAEEERLAAAMIERMREDGPEEFSELPPGHPYLDVALESNIANLRQTALALREGRRSQIEPPPQALTEAISAARARTAWGVIERGYRLGQAVLQEQADAEVERWQLPSDERLSVMQGLSRFVFNYVDGVLQVAYARYQAERDLVVNARRYRQAAWVRELLKGASSAIGDRQYSLERRHIGIVAWGAHAENTIRDLAAEGGAALLAIPGEGDTLWAWLSSSTPLALPEHVTSRKMEQAVLSIGEEAFGLSGFRLTHWQAREASRVARLSGESTTYAETSVLALTLRDEVAARRFIAHELGSLLDGDSRSELLLRTLRAYVDGDYRFASAARPLGVHERTVGYRIAAIEKRLGRPVAGRRGEISLALRLLAMLEP